MPGHTKIIDLAGSTSLTFYCGELPVEDVVSAAGHEPNGYFWEGLLRYVAPDLAAEVELDAEAGMFAAYGDRATLQSVKDVLDGYLDDAARVSEAIDRAESSGFELDD